MAEVKVRIAEDQEVVIHCAPHEQRRVDDLAALLQSRLSVFAGEPDKLRRLVLTALALMDETQAAGAALARARAEIDRLNDVVGDAHAGEADASAGRVGSLTREGAA